MDLKKETLEAVKNNLNVPGLVAELFKDVLKQAIDEVVKKTPTVLDDVAAAAILPALEVEVNTKFKALWDGLFVAEEPKSEGQGDVL